MEIELSQVSKHFGAVRALAPVDVRLGDGKLLLITGPNGSGKSTLLRILATALAPDQGHYFWDGRPVRTVLQQARKSIGYLGEHMGLYDDLTVAENIAFWGDVYGRKSTPEEIATTLRLWKLDRHAARPVRNLSQGMVRRAGLAKISIQNPRLILLDEPFNGLDEENTAALVNILGTWKKEGRCTAVATHQPETIAFLANQRLSLGHLGTSYSFPNFIDSGRAKVDIRK